MWGWLQKGIGLFNGGEIKPRLLAGWLLCPETVMPTLDTDFWGTTAGKANVFVSYLCGFLGKLG